MGAPLRRGLLCFVRHIKMYFCIHFRIRIHQHFQPCFSTLRFLLKKQHFPFGTGFAYSCMFEKISDNKPLTKEKSLCSHYNSSSPASPPSTTSSNTSTATNNPPHPNQKKPRYMRNRTRIPRQILLNPQLSYLPPETNPGATRIGDFSLFRVKLCDFSRK
ncbi:hypothetical protein BGX16_2897 [Hallerella succinigenes]|uniref:Uncharacterized protein n=1 Tax=Hallerella succinigenes TaxID=1896222 RepID=A0A2M9AAU1_9BACT|nr:hypothetical protein BGX16_2897 [Hallerella succinigenes]